MENYNFEIDIISELSSTYNDFLKLVNLYNSSCYGRKEIAAKAEEKAQLIKRQIMVIAENLSQNNFVYDGLGANGESKLEYYLSPQIILSVLERLSNRNGEDFRRLPIGINLENDDVLVDCILGVDLLVTKKDLPKFVQNKEYCVDELAELFEICEGSFVIGLPWNFNNLDEQIYKLFRKPDHTFKVMGKSAVGCFYGNDNLSNAVNYLENFVSTNGADFNRMTLETIERIIVEFNERPDVARKRMPKLD